MSLNIKKTIRVIISLSIIIIGSIHLFQIYEINNNKHLSLKENQKLKYILFQFQYDLERFGFNKNIINKIKYYEMISPYDKYFVEGSCSNNILKINTNVYKYSYNYQKRFLYHELGHCLFNYAHNHKGIMSYKDFNKPLSPIEIKNFFKNINQNDLSIFDDLNYFNIVFLNTRILNKSINSKFKFNELYTIQVRNISYLRINLIIGGVLLYLISSILLSIFKFTLYKIDDYLDKKLEEEKDYRS